jgi:hypothetical protein
MNRNGTRIAQGVRPSVEPLPHGAAVRREHPVGAGTALRTGAALAVALAVGLAAAQGRADTPCVGDCGNTGQVTVSDIVLGVNIVLEIQPASACPNFQNAEGHVDIAQLIEGVNNLLNGCGGLPTATPTQTPLVTGKERRFVVAPGTPRMDSTMTTTGLFTSGLSNGNAATAICGRLAGDGQSCATPAVLTLVLGDPDAGISDLILKEDVRMEIGIVDGSRICLTLLAATSEGNVDCEGGHEGYDITATRNAGEPGLGFRFQTHQGALAAVGDGELLIDTRVKILAAGDTTACDQVSGTDLVVLAFTTTDGTASVIGTELNLSARGQAFSCENFATPGSGGMLTAPIPANQPPVGDVVNALRFGEQAP